MTTGVPLALATVDAAGVTGASVVTSAGIGGATSALVSFGSGLVPLGVTEAALDTFNLNFLPLVVAILLTIPVAFSPFHPGINRWTKRMSLLLFGRYVNRIGRNREHRQTLLNQAHFPVTFRVYSAKTLFYSTLLAFAGAIYGVYILWGFLRAQRLIDERSVKRALPDPLSFISNLFRVSELAPTELFVLLLISSSTVGLMLGLATYSLRWWWPSNLANARRRRIEADLPSVISFIYALSRSGMNFPRVLRTLAENRSVYGDGADEVAVAVREMDVMGKDLVTAIVGMAERTPSEQFEEFSANLASILQSGRSLSQFLRDQHEFYREQTEAQQEQLLELLSTLAEVYVTVLVAGPLFMITILVVLGLALGGTLGILQMIVYGIIPLANIVFILYLSMVTESLRATRDRIQFDDPFGGIANVRRLSDSEDSLAQTDGGSAYTHPNVERLERYETFRGLREQLSQPARTLMHNPLSILWVTAPIALVYVLFRLPAAISLAALTPPYGVGINPSVVDIRVLDDIVVRATLLVTITFSIVHYAYIRRINRIENAIPDFLDRLASINEAGMTIVESIGRLRNSDLRALNNEIDRIWGDIEWGADVESALYRFERRVDTTMVTRMVTLLNNSMASSGDLSEVLKIAASQAKADRRLKRERNQEMVTYLMVVYISFFVFLFIIAALTLVLIPALPSGGVESEAASESFMGSIDKAQAEDYTLIFFHTAIIQGVFSGFVAGQMGGGNPQHGAKHASILLLIAYAAFLVM